MKQAPIPENDEARLEALHDYELLAGSPESWFNHIASVASSICQVPIAMVSLIDRDEQLLKAASGLPPELHSASRASSFCGHAILEEGLFEVPDASQDTRFHDNPWVTGAHNVRFYASVPLVNEAGHALGTICVMDHKPRCLSDDQGFGLASLAQVVMQHLETRRSETFGRHLERLIEASDDFVAVVDASSLQVLHANARLYDLIDTALEWSDPAQLSALDLFPSLSGDFLKGLVTEDTENARPTDLVSVPIVSSSEAQNRVRLRITASRVRERPVLLLVAEAMSMEPDSLKEVRFARDRLRNLALVAKLTNNPVIITDPQGTIEWANPSFERLTGYQLDDVIGKKPGAFLQGPDTDTQTRRRISTGLARGEHVREAILNRDRHGRRYWLDLDIQPVRDEQGELAHFVSVQTDITELKEMEERQREARQAAEAANNAKTAFLANASHELRTPLNGIIGIAGILERNPDRPDRRDQLGALQASASGLLGLINDLLDLSQIEAGSMPINPHPFRLSRHLGKIDYLLRPETERKGIGLIIERDPGMPDGLHGDGMRMCQILINLLNNAIKFTETGRVRLSINAPSTSGNTARVVFTVSDTGPGMPASVQEHIFEPFSQADDSVVRQYGGAGLGLAICRRLVRLMDGSIRLDSEVGKGTTFTVTLPFAIASQADMAALEADAESPTMPSLAVHDYRVLLVEDSEINRHVATAMLDELGLTTVGCESGQEALDAFRAGAFDLVLLDIQMPDMSGYEVVEAMRAIEAERGQRTPILAVTAHSESVASLDTRSEAFDALVRKPLTFQGLQDAIKGWLTASDNDASGSGIDSSRHSVTEPAPAAGEDSALIDEALVMSNLSGDVRLVHTLMDLFERQHGHYLDLIDTAVQSGDTAALADAAHKLKGAVGYFNQSGLWQEVAELEKVASEGERDVTDRVKHIREQVFALADEVRCFSLSR